MKAHDLARALLAGPDIPVAAAQSSTRDLPYVAGDPELYESLYVEHLSGMGRMAVILLTMDGVS